LRSYLDSLAASIPATASDLESARLRRSLMLRARADRGVIPGLPNGVVARDVAISAEVTGRLYTPPETASPLPILVYAHGGGWVCGSVETHDPFCRLLCEAAGILIFSVEFRLAPEHPYPAALDDMLAAYAWAAAHGREMGADDQRLLLGGDSAGANLAAVATNAICAHGQTVPPAAQLLLYPVLDHPSGGHGSYIENAAGHGLSAELMIWFWNQYAAFVSPEDPRISPLRSEKIPALPPTLVATAEYDPLRDEGMAYAKKLASAGVSVSHLHALDMHHNFPVHPGTVARFPQSVAALHAFAEWIRRTV
jgi:acetyl esterase